MVDECRELVSAVALSLYAFNVHAIERAKRLHDHFNGECMELQDLVDFFCGPRAQYWATELPMPTAAVYLAHAMERYEREAKERVVIEMLMGEGQ